MEVLTYLEGTEVNPESRSLDTVKQMMNARYGKTDSERAWSWLSSFTEFKRGILQIIKISGFDSRDAQQD